LALGRRELSARFRASPPCIFRAGEILVAAARSSDVIHHLRGGWACQFRDLPDGRRAIVDIYLPGDVIGLDAALRIRPLEEVMALTSLTIETINTANALSELRRVDLLHCTSPGCSANDSGGLTDFSPQSSSMHGSDWQ
jgi:CRP-like cAMP-binding protein